MGFSRQEYWSGLPCPSPGNLPNPGIEPRSLASSALADRFSTIVTTWGAPCNNCEIKTIVPRGDTSLNISTRRPPWAPPNPSAVPEKLSRGEPSPAPQARNPDRTSPLAEPCSDEGILAGKAPHRNPFCFADLVNGLNSTCHRHVLQSTR